MWKLTRRKKQLLIYFDMQDNEYHSVKFIFMDLALSAWAIWQISLELFDFFSLFVLCVISQK